MTGLFDRLDYLPGGTNQRGALILDDTINNTRILSRLPSNGIFANEYTINQIVARLQGYDFIDPDNYSTLQTQKGGWCRLLKRTDNGYEFRTGGFILKNDTVEEFIVFVNRSLNFSFAVPYNELVLFRHNPNSRNLTQGAETFVRNLMSLTLNPNADLLVALDVRTGQVYWTPNNRGKFNRLITQITNITGSRPFTRQSLNNNIRRNRNTINHFVLGFINQENLDELLILRDDGNIVDNNADERLRRLLEGFLN